MLTLMSWLKLLDLLHAVFWLSMNKSHCWTQATLETVDMQYSVKILRTSSYKRSMSARNNKRRLISLIKSALREIAQVRRWCSIMKFNTMILLLLEPMEFSIISTNNKFSTVSSHSRRIRITLLSLNCWLKPLRNMHLSYQLILLITLHSLRKQRKHAYISEEANLTILQ